MIQLSNIAPDFDALVSQLEAALLTKNAWKDRITSSTGQTIVEFCAAVGAYAQFAVESSLQEAFPESAKNAGSLYAAANFAGVRFNRKAPASVTVSLTAPSAITIPVNTQFSGGGALWFNRDVLVLGPSPVSVTLYQGEIITATMFGTGTNFQAFVTTERGFVVSDTDVFVSINSVSVPAIQEGLWTKKSLPGVQHFTLPSGQMILLFGNSLYGSKPTPTDTCNILYVVTLGEDGNNVPTLDKAFTMESNPAVTGKATSQASGGASQTNPLVYKNVTPALFGSFNASVTAAQYKALPLQYPGVLDAKTFAQREINPRALSYMNVIKVCLLTNPPMSGPQFSAFEQWFYKTTMYSTRIFRQDPVPSNITVTANVYCTNLANLGSVKAKIEAALDKFFELREGIIGLDVYKSDVMAVIQGADSNVEYIELISPTTDLQLSNFNVKAPTLVGTSGGTLPAGNYEYALSATSLLGGESAPANWATVGVPPSGRVLISWEAVPNANVYKLWGRQGPGSLGLLGSFSSSTLSYIDTGAVAPSGTVPVQSTVPIIYPNLVAKNITMLFSTRNRINLEG